MKLRVGSSELTSPKRNKTKAVSYLNTKKNIGAWDYMRLAHVLSVNLLNRACLGQDKQMTNGSEQHFLWYSYALY